MQLTFARFTKLAALLTGLLAAAGATGPISATPILFRAAGNRPVVPTASGTWHGICAANPTAVQFRGTDYLYFRGIAAHRAPDAVGVWNAPALGFDGRHWNQKPVANPVLTAGRTGFDSTGIQDPCAVVFHGQVFLYYMGTANSSRIGLATSSDGLHFAKQGEVWHDGGTPCPFYNPRDHKLYLFYTRSTGNGWEYWATSSLDGRHFGPGQRVFGPSGVRGAFDRQSISTARLWAEGGSFYMIYGGSPDAPDYNTGLGLAHSRDLIHWQRYPANPILRRGPAGGWAEGGVWSGTLLKVKGVYNLWYEACGSGAGAGTAASISARNTPYGGYEATSFSQIGRATYAGSLQWGIAHLRQASARPAAPRGALVDNPGFEASGPTGTPPFWGVWTGDGNAASYTERGGHMGTYRCTQSSKKAFQVYTSQTITDIPNGVYTLKAWVVGGGGQKDCFMSAKQYAPNAPELKADIKPLETGYPHWKQVSLSNIRVTNHKCTVGFYSFDPAGGHWMSFDDVTFHL